MKKLLLSFGIALTLTGTATAQDVHFTQYFTSPLTLNPALTGLIPEDLRFAANYRSQWSAVSSTPYTTATASFDIATFKNKLPEGDALGLGLVFEHDQSGTGSLTNTTAGLSLAYHKAFGHDRTQHLSMGFQGYFVQKSIDFSKLTFYDMYNAGMNNFSGSTHVVFKATAVSYMDFNGGIMYSGKVTDHTTAYIGYSYYHVTQPVESFIADTYQIHSRSSLYLGGSFDMNENAVLYASALYQEQASASEVLIGAAAGFVLNPGHDQEYQKHTIFYIGGWYRYGDAVCPYISLEWSKMRIGVSYDANISSFTPATSGFGGYEISLIYTGRINKHERNPQYDWSCPKIF